MCIHGDSFRIRLGIIMLSLLNLQGEIILLLAAGLVLRKRGVLKAEAKIVLTDLIIFLILPCNIISSFQVDFSLELLKKFGIILIIALGIQLFAFVLSRLIYKKESRNRSKVLQYATLVSNAGFMGNPIAESIFGSTGLLYASVYLIPQRIIMWSAGLSLFTKSPDKKSLLKKILTHPCIVAVEIGMLLLITGLRPPGFLNTTIKVIGNCTTPMSMILIGTILNDVNVKDAVDKKVIGYTMLRLFIIPGVSYICCLILGADTLVANVTTLLAAMPAGSTTAILAEKYDCDAEFATKIVVFSTFMTIVSIPIWNIIFSLN